MFQHLVFMISYLILFPGRQLLPTPKHFKYQPWTYWHSPLASTSPSFRIQASGIDISSLYPTTFPERNSHKNWHLSIKTQKQRHSGYRENVYSRVFLIVHLVFNARWTVVTPTLLCSTCITFLLNIFWGIHQELFFMFIPKKIAKLQKENHGGAFLKKLLAYSIQIFWMELHDKCLSWNHW